MKRTKLDQEAELARRYLARHPEWIDALVLGEADEIDEIELCERLGVCRTALNWGCNRAIQRGF